MKYLVLALFVFTFFACGSDYFFDEDKSIDKQTWANNNKLKFDVNIEEIESAYNFFIDFRHNDNYPYADIYFFMDIKFPDGKQVHDTVGYIMQEPDGHWRGKNSGSIIDNHVLIKSNIKLPQKGMYTFTIAHGMRDKELEGIEDVGLAIEKVK